MKSRLLAAPGAVLFAAAILLAGCRKEPEPVATPVWVELQEEARALTNRGDYERASIVLENAIREAEGSDLTPPYALLEMEDQLAECCSMLGNLNKEVEWRERALDTAIDYKGQDDPGLIERHQRLAALQSMKPDFVKCEAHHRRALALAEAALGTEAAGLATLLTNYADSLLQQEKNAEAEALLTRALNIANAHPGQDLASGPNALLSVLRERQGNRAEAEDHLIRNIAEAEGRTPLDQGVLEHHVETLARFYMDHDEHAKAEPVFERLLTLKQPRLGPGHAEIGELHFYLGEIRRITERYEEALAAYQRALEIVEAATPARPGEQGLILNQMGLVYGYLDRWGEAESSYIRALPIEEGVASPESLEVATVLCNLGNAYLAGGKVAEGEKCFRRSLEIRLKQLGPSHLDTARAQRGLSQTLISQYHFSEALPLAKQALATQEATLGSNDPATVDSRNLLARILRELGRKDEAAKLEATVAGAPSAPLPAPGLSGEDLSLPAGDPPLPAPGAPAAELIPNAGPGPLIPAGGAPLSPPASESPMPAVNVPPLIPADTGPPSPPASEPLIPADGTEPLIPAERPEPLIPTERPEPLIPEEPKETPAPIKLPPLPPQPGS